MARSWLLWAALAFVGGAVAAGVTMESGTGGIGSATPFGGVMSQEADARLVGLVENEGSHDVVATLKLFVDGREVEREEVRVPPGVREVAFSTVPPGRFLVRAEFATLGGGAQGSTAESGDMGDCDRGEKLVVSFEVEASRNAISLGRADADCV